MKPAISLGFLLLVAGCSLEPDVTATDSDNNHHIQLKSGDVFDIVLADDYATTCSRHAAERWPNCTWYLKVWASDGMSKAIH